MKVILVKSVDQSQTQGVFKNVKDATDAPMNTRLHIQQKFSKVSVTPQRDMILAALYLSFLEPKPFEPHGSKIIQGRPLS